MSVISGALIGLLVIIAFIGGLMLAIDRSYERYFSEQRRRKDGKDKND